MAGSRAQRSSTRAPGSASEESPAVSNRQTQQDAGRHEGEEEPQGAGFGEEESIDCLLTKADEDLLRSNRASKDWRSPAPVPGTVPPKGPPCAIEQRTPGPSSLREEVWSIIRARVSTHCPRPHAHGSSDTIRHIYSRGSLFNIAHIYPAPQREVKHTTLHHVMNGSRPLDMTVAMRDPASRLPTTPLFHALR